MRCLCLSLVCTLPALGCAQTDEQLLRAKTQDVVLAIKEKNFAVLAAHMKPNGRLRFAPYVYLTGSDRMLTKSQVAGFFGSSTVRNWGSEDGTGDPILLTNSAYFNRYVYNRDFFMAPTVTFNARAATGNTPSNFATVYPGRMFFEHYSPAANPGDLDWYALNVIWQKDGLGIWRLVALAHDQWTT